MRKILLSTFLILGLSIGLAACGGSSSGSSSTTQSGDVTTTSEVTTSTLDQYSSFIALNNKLNGDAWSGTRSDAATRAMLLCNGSAKQSLGGVSLQNFPTDLALVRTYCPKVESTYP